MGFCLEPVDISGGGANRRGLPVLDDWLSLLRWPNIEPVEAASPCGDDLPPTFYLMSASY